MPVKVTSCPHYRSPSLHPSLRLSIPLSISPSLSPSLSPTPIHANRLPVEALSPAQINLQHAAPDPLLLSSSPLRLILSSPPLLSSLSSHTLSFCPSVLFFFPSGKCYHTITT